MNATRQFLGKPENWKDVQLHLSSLQGLWGGWCIFVFGNRDAVIQHVAPAMREERFRVTLTDDEFTAMIQTCIKHDLLAVPAPQRPGNPDETMLEVTLINPQLESLTARKWAGDSHPDFDPVYKQIFALTNRIQKLVPFYTGIFDWSASRPG